MIDTLSKRCEELEAQVKLAQKPNFDTTDGSKFSGLTEDTKEQSGSKSPVKTEDQVKLAVFLKEHYRIGYCQPNSCWQCNHFM